MADPIDGPSIGGNLDHRLPKPATTTVEFARDIKPIFLAACFKCHGSDTDKGGFSLATMGRPMEFAEKSFKRHSRPQSPDDGIHDYALD